MVIDTSTTGYSRQNAVALGRAARAVYGDRDAMEVSAANMQLGQPDVIEDKPLDAFVTSGNGIVVVVFRGTEPKKPRDVIANLIIDKDATNGGSGSGGRVHSGYDLVLSRAWPQIHGTIAQHGIGVRNVYVTGHSAGGAFATLAADRLGSAVAGLYTFGAPRVGDRTFAGRINAGLGERSVRFVHERDPVPFLPTIAMRYQHARHEKRIDAQGKVQDGAPPVTTFAEFLGDFWHHFRRGDSLLRWFQERIGDHGMAQYLAALEKTPS